VDKLVDKNEDEESKKSNHVSFSKKKTDFNNKEIIVLKGFGN
jgi:hypothetical protein